MKQTKKQRNELYKLAEAKLKFPTAANRTTLYHHIHSMRLSDNEYIFKTEEDLNGLLNFLNAERELHE